MPKTRRSASSACPLQFFGNKKNHMPDARGACRAYDWAYSFHRLRTPSTACGRSPSLEEGGLWLRRSRPTALPSIAYRGFAVAPITLRAPSRRVVVITSGTDSFHRLRAVPLPRRGRSWGIRRSRPAALPSIGYRGFAVAPMTLRAPSRRFLYNSGCRVETLLVSKGVMGFLGDLRGKNRNFPLIP